MEVVPLVENAGAVFAPRAQLYVVDEAQRVLAGPLVLARRRAYHRAWLLGFAGITSREAVDGWRGQLVAVEEGHADG